MKEYLLKLTVSEERDLFINVEGENHADACSKLKQAIEYVGLSNIKVQQESITETDYKIADIDFDEID